MSSKISKNEQNIWAGLERKFITLNFKKSDNLVTLFTNHNVPTYLPTSFDPRAFIRLDAGISCISLIICLSINSVS